MSTQSKYSIFAFLSCFVLGFLVYYNSLDVPFYLDDFRNIVKNSSIRINQLTLSSLIDAAFNSTIPTRPVANISFALNYFFHQESVFGYHLVNIIIHIITGFLVYQLTVATLSTPALESKYKKIYHIAFFASVLWLVHPLHTQSVTYIVQRMNSMATMFYLLSLLCYVKGRLVQKVSIRWSWFFVSSISAIFAIGSKEISLTLPLIIICYEWYFFQDLCRRWILDNSLLILVSIASLLGIIWLYPGDFPDIFFSAYQFRSFSMLERILTESRVVIYYLSLLLMPHPKRLNLDHDFIVSTSFFTPITTFISFTVILLIMLTVVLSARKFRLLSFVILWYFVNLFIESSFIGLEIIFEHRTYLPSIFLVIFLCVFIYDKIKNKWVITSMVVFYIVLCSFWTIKRNQIWRDPILFWSDTVNKSPGKARPYINLSISYRDIGEFDKSLENAKKAIEIGPNYIYSYVNLGACYYAIGKYNEAIEEYNRVLRMKSDYYDVYNALGNLYLKQGKTSKAIEAFRTNLKYDPKNYESLVNLAAIKAYNGLLREAIVDFQKAVELSGKKPDVLFNLAIAYTNVGDNVKAIEVYKELLNINPDDKQAQANLRKLQGNQLSPNLSD